MMNDKTIRVIGTKESKPLEFWIGVPDEAYVQLDEVVAVETPLPDPTNAGGITRVSHYGVIDDVQSTHEGASVHSDVFRIAQGSIGSEIATIAHVSVTRVEPEVFVPPRPGQQVRRADATDRDIALYFDGMIRRFPAGLSRDGLPIYGNLEFLDGSRGAHVNISGISGVATKTTYAMFLLYGLFHSESSILKSPQSTHAIVFNVKGDDLLYLDKENKDLLSKDPDAPSKYEKLGLAMHPFLNVGLWAPPSRGDVVLPDTSRLEGVVPYYWTLHEFCRDRMLRFLFADADDETTQIGLVVAQVERFLENQVQQQSKDEAALTLEIPGASPKIRADSFDRLVDFVDEYINDITERVADATKGAFLRRLVFAAHEVGSLIRAEPETDAVKHRFDWTNHQVNVIDINRLSDRAKRFVVGVVVKRLMEQKEDPASRQKLFFLVLDELNKYAPREGRSPIKEVVLDIAERGRSLGVVLIGAEQTASEIERRVTANASFRVVGRLDAAESQRDEYGFLTSSARVRSSILKPGSMFLQQPDVPVPLLVQFPFPSWATRADEVAESAKENIDSLFEEMAKNTR
jgi:DNA helicase HerA-like ATPase